MDPPRWRQGHPRGTDPGVRGGGIDHAVGNLSGMLDVDPAEAQADNRGAPSVVAVEFRGENTARTPLDTLRSPP